VLACLAILQGTIPPWTSSCSRGVVLGPGGCVFFGGCVGSGSSLESAVSAINIEKTYY